MWHISIIMILIDEHQHPQPENVVLQFKVCLQKRQPHQNPDQKASKRVCPTRVCPTSVSVRASAQQLRPQRLKHWNPLLPFSLMCCLRNFFLVIKAAVFYMEFWFMTGLPQESKQFFVFANSQAQWAKCQAGNHPTSGQSLAHKRFVSQKSATKRNWWEKISREFRLGGLSPCGKQDYPPVGNVFVFHSSVIFSHLTHVLFVCLLCFSFFFYLFFLFFSVPFIGFPITSQNARKKKTKNPKSKLQNRDRKTSKRVCPTRVCLTSASA